MFRKNSARSQASTDLNHLERGSIYRAITPTADATGEYLGIETGYGVWSILLRHESGTTESIPLFRIESIAAA